MHRIKLVPVLTSLEVKFSCVVDIMRLQSTFSAYHQKNFYWKTSFTLFMQWNLYAGVFFCFLPCIFYVLFSPLYVIPKMEFMLGVSAEKLFVKLKQQIKNKGALFFFLIKKKNGWKQNCASNLPHVVFKDVIWTGQNPWSQWSWRSPICSF